MVISQQSSGRNTSVYHAINVYNKLKYKVLFHIDANIRQQSTDFFLDSTRLVKLIYGGLDLE